MHDSNAFSSSKAWLLKRPSQNALYNSLLYWPYVRLWVMFGACWDNAVVERFFGSLKHDLIFKAHQPTREHMTNDVCAYIKYYNFDRLHSSNNDLSPIQYENLANS